MPAYALTEAQGPRQLDGPIASRRAPTIRHSHSALAAVRRSPHPLGPAVRLEKPFASRRLAFAFASATSSAVAACRFQLPLETVDQIPRAPSFLRPPPMPSFVP